MPNWLNFEPTVLELFTFEKFPHVLRLVIELKKVAPLHLLGVQTSFSWSVHPTNSYPFTKFEFDTFFSSRVNAKNPYVLCLKF